MLEKSEKNKFVLEHGDVQYTCVVQDDKELWVSHLSRYIKERVRNVKVFGVALKVRRKYGCGQEQVNSVD